MMKIQRLVSIGYVGFFLMVGVMSVLATGNRPTAVSNHPQPVRAPMSMQEPVQTTPTAPGGVTATAANPQPQPVPVPPAAAATVAAPTQAEAAPASLLLLVVTVIGALIGLMVLGQSRQRENGRLPQPSILAHGAQS